MLEDGSVYAGTAAGKFKETVFETVFNTSMTGYVELLSDPSNLGKGIIMTYPLIGNYGVCLADMEADKLFPSALLVHELCDTPSNFRCEMTLEELLNKYDIPCVTDLDTREIVMNIRENGTMRAIITDDISDKDALMAKISAFDSQAVAVEKSSADGDVISTDGIPVAFIDLGARKSSALSFADKGFAVTKYSADVTAEAILNSGAEGVVISNGPEVFTAFENVVAEIKKLMDAGMPLFAIGLGHQLVAKAQGGKVEKMLYGHRGANYPVKFTAVDETYITTHNHGYTVTNDGVPAGASVLCVNVNDGTVEGLSYNKAITVQFIPDTARGHNTSFLYNDFAKMIKEGK